MPRSPHLPPTRGRSHTRFTVVTLAISMLLVGVPGMTGTASATIETIGNNNVIMVPGGQPTSTDGRATPYPSIIEVRDVHAPIYDLNATVHNINHTAGVDLDLLLVAPDGTAVVLMSDAAGGPLVSTTLVFDDGAGSNVPLIGPIPQMTSFRPTNLDGNDAPGDSFPTAVADPPPAGPYATTMAAFQGLNPNGDWKLYVDDDQAVDVGYVGAWSLTFTAGPSTLTDRFTDDATNVHHDAINYVAAYGLTTGGPGPLPGTMYGPAFDVSRAQMASFVARLIEAGGVTLPSNPPDAFMDDETSVHELRINQLYWLGIVDGSGSVGETTNQYFPGAPMRRDHMAEFIRGALVVITGFGFPPPATDYFTDDNGNANEIAINNLAELGIVFGTSPGTYNPSGTVRRDSMASYFGRTIDVLIGWGFLTGLP